MARILITGFFHYPGPRRLGVQLEHVIEGLQRNHQVDVLCLRHEAQAHNERIGATRVLRVAPSEPNLAQQIESFRRALRRQIEGEEYDVIHFCDGWTGTTALNMQAKHGYATVFDLARSPMAEPVLTDLATAKELELAHERCIRSADLVLAPTEGVRQFLASATELAKIHVVPPGVNVDRFDWEPPHQGGNPVILYLGSLHAGCGIRLLLSAFREVASKSDAILVLAGDASDTFTDSVQRLVQELDLAGRVRMLGELPNKLAPAVIARAAICVAPAAIDLESVPTALYPTKILEYMACQRAVVAPKRSSVQKLVRDQQQALLFEAGDPNDLARKLLLLLEDSDLRIRIAHGGYQLARTSHTSSNTRRTLRAAYHSIHRLSRFAVMQEESTKTGSITDLGLDVNIRELPRGPEARAYSDDTAMYMEEAEPELAEAGEVTQVQIFPLPGDPKTASASDNSLLTAEAQDEYTDEWQVGPDGVPREVRDAERTGPMSASLQSVISNVIVEEARPQHAQTRIVKSPFVDNEKTIGGAPLQRPERRAASARQDETQPQTKRPVPRAPKLPKAKGASKTDGGSKSTRVGGPTPPISDDKRS